MIIPTIPKFISTSKSILCAWFAGYETNCAFWYAIGPDPNKNFLLNKEMEFFQIIILESIEFAINSYLGKILFEKIVRAIITTDKIATKTNTFLFFLLNDKTKVAIKIVGSAVLFSVKNKTTKESALTNKK